MVIDCGSKYVVSGCFVESCVDIDVVFKDFKCNKKFVKVMYNIWVVVLMDGILFKGDDGESGVGLVIVWMFEWVELSNYLIVVICWYGGVKFGGDWFWWV